MSFNIFRQQVRFLSSKSAALTKPGRPLYMRLYPTLVVRPDGSTIMIRYHEPRQIIKLPINIWTLSEAERKAKLENRKPKQKVKYEEDVEDDYDSTKYLLYLKKKK